MNNQELVKKFSYKLDLIVNDRYNKRILFVNDYYEKYNEDISAASKNWFASRNLPKPEVIYNLCELLDCDFDYLFGNQQEYRREFKSVSDYLDLSDKAIEHISKLNKAQKHALNIMFETYQINRLLESLVSASVFINSNGNLKISLDSAIYRDNNVVKNSKLSGNLKNFEDKLNKYRSEQMLTFQINQDTLEMIKFVLNDDVFKEMAVNETTKIIAKRHQITTDHIQQLQDNPPTRPQKPNLD